MICCKDCFIILHNERGQDRHGNYIYSFFWKKILFNAVLSFWPKKGTSPQLFESALRSFFCTIKGTAKSYMKLVFWEKISFGPSNVIFLGYFLLFDWVWSKLSQARPLLILDLETVRTWFLSWLLLDLETVRVLKWSGHRFSTFIWWILNGYYVMFICRGRYSTEGRTILWKSFFKNFLHNFIWMKTSLNAKNW